ncbi:unnamed protein product [Sphagnum jensenii]|jgi:hypothetical protein|uniref:Epidermal patterning factor-like protein n=1 Tax=Sphagnum jensenii TaxID=128206 RepID=A0ABP0WQZ9_9BRYO
MITANLPFVRRGDRQRDKSRARRRVRVLAITMLYISMFVLLALSRGFTIGGGAAARGSAVAALSTETNLSTGQGAAAGDHSQLDDQAATGVRRRSEIRSGSPPQKLVLSISSSGWLLRQTRATAAAASQLVHLYGQREEEAASSSRSSSSSSSSNRRLLQEGPGSSLPSCTGKCGVCSPCKPVHVTIGSPHEVISETEYYPEVWRCQCGNKLFIP